MINNLDKVSSNFVKLMMLLGLQWDWGVDQN